MLLADVGTTVELLIARRHVQRRVPVEKVGRLELDFDDLARHDREVLNARDVLKTKLHPNHDIIVYNILFTVSPRSYPSTSTRLVSRYYDRQTLLVCDERSPGQRPSSGRPVRGSYKRLLCHSLGS